MFYCTVFKLKLFLEDLLKMNTIYLQLRTKVCRISEEETLLFWLTFLASFPSCHSLLSREEYVRNFFFWGGEAVNISTGHINSGFLHATGMLREGSPKGRLDTWQTWGLRMGNSDLLACSLVLDLSTISLIFWSLQLDFYLSFDSKFWWRTGVL